MRTLTRVAAVFNGTHTDPNSGVLHGHDYEVAAVWLNTSRRFEDLAADLSAFLAPLNHTPLPDGIWSAEDLGRWMLARLGCAELEINRRAIGHCVKVTL